MELNYHGPWTESDAPHSDVIMSCRARVARNIAGFPFVNKASERQLQEILNISRQVLLGGGISEGMFWIDLPQATARDRHLLVERHLISKHHAASNLRRGVAISGDEALSIMVNEEDHLRMQILAPGLRLSHVHRLIDEVDDAVEKSVDYAFSPRWGYLTACPTNVGTGIRFSVRMHLPDLKITNEIDRVRRAAKDLHLAVRGYYGEGSESAGDFYQISNQITLGRTEDELRMELEEAILPRIIDYELKARKILIERSCSLLDDRTHRALGILRSARLLGTEEAMKLLSRVRLGVHLERLKNVDLEKVNRLFLQIQPAHLKLHIGREMDSDELRAARADIVRQTMNQG